ncbi:MAG: Xaa-Pro peptidase family protein [Pseudomonadota bacterium]
MAHLDRARAGRLMQAAGLDAVILLSPESFSHATGAPAGVATMWRRAGAVAVLVPADPGVPELAVVSDLFAPAFRKASAIADLRESPIWVETANLHGGRVDWGQRAPGFARPTTFEDAICWRHLAGGMAERGLSRVGVELAAISARDWPGMAAVLPGLVDATELVARLKMVKSPSEITLLRRAAHLAETGISAVRDAIAPGISRDDLAAVWASAIAAHRGDAPLSGAWEYISVGPDPWGGNAVARKGDLVKVDVGCVMAGYTSDTGRTFCLGPPDAHQTRLFDALAAGFAAGSALLTPGTPMAEVHRATQAAIRAAGFPEFSRGHFGHGLGASLGSEEWPFFAADSPVTLEPGMVLAFETPWYVTGLGGLILENQYLITETGADCMNTLPTGMIGVG